VTIAETQIKENFYDDVNEIIKNQKHNCEYLTKTQYDNIIEQVCEAKNKTKEKTDLDYRRQDRYDVITVGNDKQLISLLTEDNKSVKYFVVVEDLFDIIHKAHLSIGHDRRN